MPRPRIKAIRDSLDEACQSRFADGLNDGLLAPMAAAQGPVNAAAQIRLEDCARDLRTLETAARKLGSGVNYDRMLEQAAEAVRSASDSGTLSHIRQIRLLEILAGPEAAEAMCRG